MPRRDELLFRENSGLVCPDLPTFFFRLANFSQAINLGSRAGVADWRAWVQSVN